MIWLVGLSSEFKIQYMPLLIQELSNNYKNLFIWTFSTLSHGKDLLDGVGGKVRIQCTQENHEPW